MQTIILCGGLGTRLREETEYRPKPMVNIGTRPILWHIMKGYAHHGFQDFILALGYKGNMIKDYFTRYEVINNDVSIELGKPQSLCIHQRHDECGWNITLADTGEQTLKGARLKKIDKYLTGDTFMATYGDGVSDVDISALAAFHKSHGKMVTMTAINPISRFGELKTIGNQVVAFTEKPKTSSAANHGLINGGFFVFDRRIMDYLTFDDACDLEIGPLEEIAAKGQLMVYKHKGFWSCMDTLRDMEYLNRLWDSGKARWKVWDNPEMQMKMAANSF